MAYLKFGFQRTHLWHFFDHEIQEKEASKYYNNMLDLLEKIQLPLPISYAYYLIKPEDEEREFNTLNLHSQHYGSVNPYYDEGKTVFIRQFILDETGTSFHD